MKNVNLGVTFNPSGFYLVTCKDAKKANKESPEFNKKLFEHENLRFNKIVENLQRDFEKTGLNLTFSSEILIHRVAMNLMLLEKIIIQSHSFPFLNEIHNDIVLLKKSLVEKEYKPLNTQFDLHPFFEKMIFKLQKEIDTGLKQLGLLPVQQIERQKLTIIKKLRQRCKMLEKEYIFKTESQKNMIKKEDLKTKKNRDYCST